MPTAITLFPNVVIGELHVIGSISAPNGIILLINDAHNNFSCLQFGGTSNLFPALKRNGSGLLVVKADDSGLSFLSASDFVASNVIAVGNNYAESGAIRLDNNAYITWRNQMDNGDIRALTIASDNQVWIGADSAGLVFHTNAVAPAATGQRYIVIDTNGKITSSAVAPIGT